MDAEATVRAFWYALDARDWATTRALLDDEFVAELPVSGERFVGPETFVRMNREYPGGWALTVVRVVGAGDQAASEVRARLDGKTDTALSFYRLRNGKIIWAADWWPEPYPAPAARSALASPPVAIDPRLTRLEALDDARCALLQVVEPLTGDLRRAIGGGSQRPVDVVDRLASQDQVVLASVNALCRGHAPPGPDGDEERQGARTKGDAVAIRDSMARLYRARADLRMALWQAPAEIWESTAFRTAGGMATSLEDAIWELGNHEQKVADELRFALGTPKA
jgi:hypothetical protein